MSRKRVTVTLESDSGRNQRFHDNYSGTGMSRAELVRAIRSGQYPNCHVRNINGIDTPVSNPDRSESNNLD